MLIVCLWGFFVIFFVLFFIDSKFPLAFVAPILYIFSVWELLATEGCETDVKESFLFKRQLEDIREDELVWDQLCIFLWFGYGSVSEKITAVLL